MPLSQLRIWLLAARPKTLWASVAPVIIGTAITASIQPIDGYIAVLCLAGAIVIQIGANFANDYYDCLSGADTADRQGPLRVTQAGHVTPETMKRAFILTFIIAAVIGLLLMKIGGWPILLLTIAAIACAILYTGGPFPLGYNGLGDVFAGLFFGPVAVGATAYLQTGELSMLSILAGVMPGGFAVAMITVNNLRDIDGDQRSGKCTLVVMWGKRFAQVEFTAAILIATVVIPIILYNFHPSQRWCLLSLLIIIPAIPAIKTVWHQANAEQLNQTLATTGKLMALHSILFAFGWLVS